MFNGNTSIILNEAGETRKVRKPWLIALTPNPSPASPYLIPPLLLKEKGARRGTSKGREEEIFME